MEPGERPPAPPPNKDVLLDQRIWGATPRIKVRHVRRLDLPPIYGGSKVWGEVRLIALIYVKPIRDND